MADKFLKKSSGSLLLIFVNHLSKEESDFSRDLTLVILETWDMKKK